MREAEGIACSLPVLEKVFDTVPHEVIWRALRRHRVPEVYVQWIKLIYHRFKSRANNCRAIERIPN